MQEPIPADRWADEVKGWLLFLNADRDAYHSRAQHIRPSDWKPPVGSFKADHVDFRDDTCIADNRINCVVPQPMTARNRALLAKIRIMLYHLDGDDGPILDDEADVTICMPNPALGPGAAVNPGPDFIMWSYVENADFGSISMTRTGTVTLSDELGERVLIDQEALDTGRVYFCSLGTNGQVSAGCHIRPQVILCEWWIKFIGLGHRVSNLMSDMESQWKATSSHPLARNRALDMEQPILDILEDCKPFLHGGIDEWMDDIERYAPGYLDMEEAGSGMAPDYDLTKFRNSEELESIPREEFDNTRVYIKPEYLSTEDD
ncbi:hypothetical protein SLS53_006926 [Cytospora paraplurivora]|uniref:Uncharacterized protein n=1 Tax=Cytospora paraplurivora TaxID=2898453 RepID=A0AAN9U2N5_9PEZI